MFKIEKYFTAKEVGDILRMNVSIVREKIKSNEIKGKKIGNKWLVAQSEVERIMAED